MAHVAPWTRCSDGTFTRPLFGLDDLQIAWNGWGASEPIAAAIVSCPSPDFDLRAALRNVVLARPDAATEVVELEKNLHLKVCPFADEEALTQWLAKVYEVVDIGNQEAQDAFEKARVRLTTGADKLLSPVAGRYDHLVRVTLLRGSNQQHVVIVRAWHVLMDGTVICEFINDILVNLNRPPADFEEAKAQVAGRLSPHALDCVPGLAARYNTAEPDAKAWQTYLGSSKSAGFPVASRLAGQLTPWPKDPPTSRCHLQFDEQATADFIAAAKAHGISVSTALSAAQIIASLRMSRAELSENNPVETVAQLNVASLRPFMTGPKRNTMASGAEGVITAADSSAWDAALRAGKPLDEAENDAFWVIAKQVDASTRRAKKDPCETASAAAHAFWTKFNAAADAMAKGKMANPRTKGLGLSQMGLMDQEGGLFSRRYEAVSLDDVNISVRSAGLMVGPHTWTFRGKLNLQLTYMAPMYESEAPAKLQKLMGDVVARVSGHPGSYKVLHDVKIA